MTTIVTAGGGGGQYRWRKVAGRWVCDVTPGLRFRWTVDGAGNWRAAERPTIGDIRRMIFG